MAAAGEAEGEADRRTSLSYGKYFGHPMPQAEQSSQRCWKSHVEYQEQSPFFRWFS